MAHFDLLKAEKVGKLKCSSPSSFGSTSPWEEVESATLESLKAARESLKTPKKLRLGCVLSLDTLPVTSRPRGAVFSKLEPQDIDDNDSVEMSRIQRALLVVMSEWNQLNSTFQLIYMEFNKSGITDMRYRNSIAETLGVKFKEQFEALMPSCNSLEPESGPRLPRQKKDPCLGSHPEASS
jgi:hypothetical protein